MHDQIEKLLLHPNLKVEVQSDPATISRQTLTYLAEWRKWNQKINLTSEKNESRILQKHVFDSFQYGLAVDADAVILDVGSGAGFPGIFLKVIFPRLKLVLVESQRKRANFLRNAVRAMKLDSIQVFDCRIEDLSADFHAQFDFAVFRGVGSLDLCMGMAAPFLKPSGKVVVRKEPDASWAGNPEENYHIFKEVQVLSYEGVASKIMSFEKCST